MLATMSALDEMLETLRARAAHEEAARAITDALRASDALIAFAIRQLQRPDITDVVDSAAGVQPERHLVLGANRPMWDANTMLHAASILRAMPMTMRAFESGRLSWMLVRSITAAVRSLPVDALARVDALVARETATDGEPDRLLAMVDALIEQLLERRTVKREERMIEGGWLALQPVLGGWGGRIYGEADADSFATICEAIDRHAPRPLGLDPETDASVRPQQRLEGLVRVCETALSGGGGRARPRLIATVQVDPVDGTPSGPAQIHWRARGPRGRTSKTTTDTLFCDADVQPIIFKGTRPVAVADIATDPSPKIREALVARDGGCRFPGCTTPAAWTDAHHINGRGFGKTTSIDELALFCRRCHYEVHRRWKLAVRPDGTIQFRYRRNLLSSRPRIRGPS